MKGPAFISIGRTDINFVVVLTTSPIVFILSYFLVSEFEVLGVALAKIAHSFLMTVSYIYAFRRITNVTN
ncbi:polysaccharide biosynthesis C-terminal domain-containing protein [Vibrio breoganii]